MKNREQNKLKGITLLETLVYITLFSMILFVIVNFMLGTQETTRRTSQRNSIHQSAQFVKQHLDHSFQKVKDIKEDGSSFNNDNGVLSLAFLDGVKTYRLSNNRIYFNDIEITPKNTRVTRLHFEPIYSKKNKVMAVKVSARIISIAEPKVFEEITYLAVIR